ncbi:hypothetical protein FFI16_012975 [Pseudomonas sp. KBS0710]|uniref:hypothetical protein n=1 Tax=Pseudomonas sp. KBS0710 TaxID=1179667 RepID=UPI00110F3B98|nr:hypothetical protein [Pseudomonas sp. KBS0710]TSD77291.1 hypothetical protein FFI16_012975 [Pseudomonas sp. KBS0710]
MSDINVKLGHHQHVDPEVSISRRYLKEFKASLTEDDIAQVLRAPNELKSRRVLNEMRVHFSQESLDAMLKEPDANEVAHLLTDIGEFLQKNCDEDCVKLSTQLYFNDYHAAYDKQKIALILKWISGRDDDGFQHIYEFCRGTAGAFEQLNRCVKDTAQTVMDINTITEALKPTHIRSRMQAH